MTTRAAALSWDEQIHRRLLRGEEAALAELYDRFAPMVHGLAARILGDSAAAEQLTREVFAELWVRPEGFTPERHSLRAWLGALTHRRAVDRLRNWRSEREIVALASAGRVRYVLGALPEPLREALAAAFFDGLSYPRTARRLGITEQAVKQRMRLALELLATALAERVPVGVSGEPVP